MKDVKYMSLIFRGAVEEYDHSGVRPSVFLDSAGGLQIYICDPILDDPEVASDISDMEFEINGGQFFNHPFNSLSIGYNRVRAEVESEKLQY